MFIVCFDDCVSGMTAGVSHLPLSLSGPVSLASLVVEAGAAPAPPGASGPPSAGRPSPGTGPSARCHLRARGELGVTHRLKRSQRPPSS